MGGVNYYVGESLTRKDATVIMVVAFFVLQFLAHGILISIYKEKN